MKKILFINACVRPESRTYILAKEVLKKMSGTVEEVKLDQAELPTLSWEMLQERQECAAKKDFSAPVFQYAKQFAEADEIVIAAPFWDYSFPALVKVYFENVCVGGLTFLYTESGRPKGLCKAQKLIYVTTSGGPIPEQNLGYDYVKELVTVLYQVPDILCVSAKFLDIQGADVSKIIEEKINEIREDKRI